MSQFNVSQQAEALALLEQMAWGDMDYHIIDMETTLRRALEATRVDWVRWDRELRPSFEADGFDEPEFSLPADAIEEMSLEERLAYVAGLLWELAMYYGLDLSGAESDRTSPAGLLRGLNDILWLPTAGQE